MALGCDFSILRIFGLNINVASSSSPSNQDMLMHSPAGDVLYASYLSMARAGLAALEFWDPASSKWGQAHMQARYSILRTFLEAGEGFVRLDHPASAPDAQDLSIRVDRSKILTVGRPAVERYLQQLHVFKCTADVEKGKELYERMTKVDSWWAESIRPIVLKKKLPRKVFVQANTVEEDGKVVLKEYEASLEGMIQSWAERDV